MRRGASTFVTLDHVEVEEILGFYPISLAELLTVPFDTLDYSQKLASAGVPAIQAEQQSELLADVLGKSVRKLSVQTVVAWHWRRPMLRLI